MSILQTGVWMSVPSVYAERKKPGVMKNDAKKGKCL